MAATVESDPVPNTFEPITNVVNDAVAHPTTDSVADASGASVKENQGLDNLTDTQLSMTDSITASLPEVTKLPTESLVDIVASITAETKKFEDTAESPIVLDVKENSKPELEQTAVMHSKDTTIASNISDATTVVAENEIGDTPKDTENATNTGVDRASTAEEVPTSSLSVVTEVCPSAQDELTPTAGRTSDTIVSEPVAGSVAEGDPVVSTSVAIEVPVAEQEIPGKLNEVVQKPEEEVITKHPDPTPVEGSAPVTDTHIIPAAQGATGVDNEDAKEEGEDAGLTEVDSTQEKYAECEVKEEDAEIKSNANEEQNSEALQQDVTIQIDNAETVQAPREIVETPNVKSLNAEEIGVEVVAPTPAIVDNRQLAESDEEDVPAEESHSEAAPIPVAALQEVERDGTETPRAEPASEVVSNSVQESTIGDQVEEPATTVVPEELVTPVTVETSTSVIEHPHIDEGHVSDVTPETVVEGHEPLTESQSEASLAAAEVQPTSHNEPISGFVETISPPISEGSVNPSAPDEAVVHNTASAIIDKSPAEEEITVVPHTVEEPSVEDAVQSETMASEPSVEETSAVDQAVEPVATPETITSAEESVIPSQPPDQSTEEVGLVEEEPNVIAEVSTDKKEDQVTVDSSPSVDFEKAPLEEPQSQEIPEGPVTTETRVEGLPVEGTITAEYPVEETPPVEEITESTIIDAPVATENVTIEEPLDAAEVSNVQEPTPAEAEVAEAPKLEHQSPDEEVFEETTAEESTQEPAASAESVKALATDTFDADPVVSVPQEDVPTEELANIETTDKEEGVEKTSIAAPATVTLTEENKVETPADVPPAAEVHAISDKSEEEIIDEVADQIDDTRVVELAKEPIADVDEKPAVEESQKPEETSAVEMVAEEPMSNVTLAGVERPMDNFVIEPTASVAEAAKGAPDEVQAHETATSQAQDVSFDTNHVISVVEPHTPSLPSAESVIEAGESSAQEVEIPAVAGAGIPPVADKGAIVEIQTKSEDMKDQAELKDLPSEAPEPSPAVAVELIADRSLDESVSASEMEEADTTTETIMVPESIEPKKVDFFAPLVEDITVAHHNAEELAPLEKLSLSIPEEAAEIERPKSPWTPSFQVTTIGHGVSVPEEHDIPTQDLGIIDVPNDSPPAQPKIVVEDKSTENGAEEVQQTPEVVETETSSLSWTPSYSVHSQGSPSPTHASLEPEIAGETAEVDPSVQIGDTVTEYLNAPTTDMDLEHSQVVANTESEIVSADEEDAPESLETEAPVVHDLESSHEENETETPISVHTTAEQEVEAYSQSQEQPRVADTSELAPLGPEDLQKSLLVDTSNLTHPSEQEHAASPSWIPSYSVNQQGSPLPPQVSLPSVAAESTGDDPNPVPVTAQENLIDDTSVPPTVVVNDAPTEEPIEQEAIEGKGSSTTSWTPSYSVTQQGADVIEETQIESLTPPDQTVDATVPERRPRRSLSEEMEESGAFSPTALIGAGVVGGTAAFAVSTAFRRSPESPNNMDSNDKQISSANGDVTPTQARPDKTFPTVEIPEDNSKFSSVSLPPLDENSALDVSSTLSPDASPISPRKRLESTTSSRLFPGGWFSNTSKIPDERASLEVAQGVFTGTKQGATAEETLASPVVEPITPVREQSSSDKRKWCVIM